MHSPILCIESISKTFQGSQESVLKDISLTVESGTILGIIGKSGAGKSTLLRCLNGLETPDDGHIFFWGNDLTQMTDDALCQVRQKIGFIFQSFNLLSRRTVFENVALPLELLGLDAAEYQQRITKTLDRVGLYSKRDSYPSQLSGGQRQRVAIARALVTESQLLLCDEFTSALDPETTLDILALLRKLNRDLGITIVFVTHDIGVIKELADDICVLDHGKIVENGPVTQVLASPHHPVTQSLLAELFHDNLPQFIQDQLHETPMPQDDIILKLIFGPKSSTKPLISMLSQQWQVSINIIVGSLNHIHTETFGHLVISIPFMPEPIDQMISFLKNHQVCVQKIGYIQWA